MFVAGALLGLSAPGYSINGVAFWWWYAWVGLVPAFWWVNQQTSYKRTALGGFLFGMAYHMVYLVWFFALYPLDWLGFAAWQSALVVTLAYLVWTSLGGVLVCGLLLLFWLLPGRNQEALNAMDGQPFAVRLRLALRLLLGLALIIFLVPWLWLEAFKHFGVIQLWIPWPLLAYTQHEVVLSRILQGSGTPVELLIVALNIGMVIGVFTPETKTVSKKWNLISLGLVYLFLLVFFVGMNFLWEEKHIRSENNFSAAVLQGNLPIDVVRGDNTLRPYAEKVYFENIAALDLKPDTLLVLPEEGIIPGWVNVEYPQENPYFARLEELTSQKQLHIVVGVSAYKVLPSDAREYYNGIVLVNPKGNPQFYFKRDLVPFGETIPYFNKEWAVSTLQSWGVNFNPPFSPGPENPPALKTGLTPVFSGEPYKIGALSCFELIKPELSKQYAKQGPVILVNTSNLGWFRGVGFSSRRLERLMQKQFLAIGQMRAAENRSFVIIAANTGISAIIDPMGNVLARSDRDGEPLPGGATLLRVGN